MPQYCPNSVFVEEIITYKKTRSKKAHERVGKRFLEIATGVMRNPCFNGYTQDRKNEMISDALFIMSKQLPKYDPTYIPSPFSYFTNIAYRAFIQKLNEHKKRDKILLPVDYIENLEEHAFTKSSHTEDWFCKEYGCRYWNPHWCSKGVKSKRSSGCYEESGDDLDKKDKKEQS